MATAHGWAELFRNADKVLGVISKSLAEESIGLIKDGFRAEADPYERRWKPKQRADGRKTLSGKTSRLKGGWHVVTTTSSGFRVAPSVAYAAAHQAPGKRENGRLKRPRRMMVPDRVIPRAWRRAYDETVAETLSAFFRGSLSADDVRSIGRGLGIRVGK